MKEKRKQVVWEKWIDPMNTNIDEVEYPGYDLPSLHEEEHNANFSLSEEAESLFLIRRKSVFFSTRQTLLSKICKKAFSILFWL